MDFDLMPPPGSNKKTTAPMDVDQTIDPNEPTYCICHQVSLECIAIFLEISLHQTFSKMFSERFLCFLLIFQISYGDMIACDNDNVSLYGAK